MNPGRQFDVTFVLAALSYILKLDFQLLEFTEMPSIIH